MIAPAKTEVTTEFGWVKGYPLNNVSYPGFGSAPGPGYGFHTGVDFGHSPDRTIYMPEDGTVTVIPWDGKTYDGNAIVFQAGNRRHFMGHMSKFLVVNGQFVKEGTPIGIMGETGFAIGVHLHWGLRVDGFLVNGLDYVTEGENVMLADANYLSWVFDACLGRARRKDENNELIGFDAGQAFKSIYFTQEAEDYRTRVHKALDAPSPDVEYVPTTVYVKKEN